MVFGGVKDGLDKIRKKMVDRPKVAFFIDGPNMIRKEFNLNLKDLKRRVEKYGRITIGKVFLNQFASEKLIEAVANEGFETVMALGDPEQKTDVDVSIAVHAMEAIYNPDIDIIALSSRDADFLPLVQKAKEKGKVTILIAVDSGLAISLKHASDHVEILK
ncbi:MAG: NYN domain-containing protein [Candidatus Aenigmarchaeota archaeon]|nr:NYN domain-containing protein [Candidatus Aenigmarchaeota archaeon]